MQMQKLVVPGVICISGGKLKGECIGQDHIPSRSCEVMIHHVVIEQQERQQQQLERPRD